MITEQDLQAAIAECQGQRNPNANTCLKLASYLIIQKEMFPKTEKGEQKDHFREVTQMVAPGYSMASEPIVKPVENHKIEYLSDTEFSQVINGREYENVLPVIDELMSVLQATNPRLYAGVMRKIEQ